MDQNTQTTTSLALAAYLATLGFLCASVTPTEVNNQLAFHFDISEEDFMSHSDIFWSRKTKIDGLTYFEALKVLKSRIYQYKN
ncbi:MAG: hypothetical protein H6772_02245 [Pseudomonadales bacterium]|nr:hypothetical protein [Pseudomonadales bacterium]